MKLGRRLLVKSHDLFDIVLPMGPVHPGHDGGKSIHMLRGIDGKVDRGTRRLGVELDDAKTMRVLVKHRRYMLKIVRFSHPLLPAAVRLCSEHLDRLSPGESPLEHIGDDVRVRLPEKGNGSVHKALI